MQASPFSRAAKIPLRISFMLCALFLLSACGWLSNKPTTTEVNVLPPLEVPPDLVKPQGKAPLQVPEVTPAKAATDCVPHAPELERIAQRVLPPQKDVRIVRDGRHRWLMVEVEPEQLWPLARKFLGQHGYRIAVDQPDIALIETDWKPLGTGADGTPTLSERLRLRIEPGQVPGSTEVYISEALRGRVADGKWELRSPDEERAAEMLYRLARYLGNEDVGQAMPLKTLDSKIDWDEDGNVRLRIGAPWEAVWRRAGIALDNLGYIIEDRDRANRVYSIYTEVASGKTEEEVKYGKPESATVRLTYTLKISEVDQATLIGVLDSAGNPDNSSQARHLLTQIQGQLR
ncbi:MAG: outer membrane protein assembly factor BamC [Gammaproteobacteria bacterium]|nr:outer membrane protein assembly factor BamC [Gammaproteobacteria bacterium]MCF6364019.1 outer membrane protein assembly factor BamC [Gammaproteobacteria bacterium]